MRPLELNAMILMRCASVKFGLFCFSSLVFIVLKWIGAREMDRGVQQSKKCGLVEEKINIASIAVC